ncbi:phosphate starvation-inducible protein PhoH [Enterococcus ureilyticus]|uniref:PhoH-like protein n=2 Tax=Enterococcus ureilyticus TaxID=1131292 RepID=A0A1E5HA28_9ENTE|nr:PhoH family protein [Enterococcus ureilyticus]MBM7688273.1 phosphate starvation-inducible PhoH-like protein [Enterococcus ureilyticus]OEG21787.1 phosphate starvation-inducible protein PhoH [Enterococcus ureilyticus]
MTENQPISLELKLNDSDDVSMLLGNHDKHIKYLEENTAVTINTRGETIQLLGEENEVQLVASVLRTLQVLIKRGIKISTPDVVSALKMAKSNDLDAFIVMYEEEILKDHHGRAIRIKNIGQKRYIDAVRKRDIIFGIGPAGTGKTFLAVVMAVSALKKGEVQKIILTRPAVEAGESLGFLPGDFKEKVDPYLRPVYDALYQVFGMEHTNRLMERGVIEIAPLAYMRGRTLDDAFVILDEAQNTTVAQMKMFLTRLGFNSRMIVNGDTSQVDLPKGVASGLIHAERTLQSIDKIAFVHFDASDVVRHPVVAQIIRAYEKENQQ